jgi:hypothetical protein
MDVALKGTPPALGARRYVLLFAGMMELSIQRVAIPNGALFFLARIQVAGSAGGGEDAEYYRTVQGPNSVLPINISER